MDVPTSTTASAVCSLLDQIVFQRTNSTNEQHRKRRRLADKDANEAAEFATEDGASGRDHTLKFREQASSNEAGVKSQQSTTAASDSPQNKKSRSISPRSDGVSSPPLSGAETDSTTTAATTPPTTARRGWLQKARVRKEEACSSHHSGGVIVSVISSPTTRKRLGFIHFDRHRDLTYQNPHESRVTALDFVSGDVAYSAGIDKCIKFYNLTPSEQLIQHTVHVKNTPIYASCLSSNKQCIINVSDRGTMFTLDISSRAVSKCPMIPSIGNDCQALKQVLTRDSILSVLDDRGRIYLLDERTYKTIKVFNSGTSIKAMTMSDNRLYSGDDGGEVFEWDLRIGRCSNRHMIEGSLGVRCLDITSNNKLAVGTYSGYVSLYALEDKFQLIKSFGNLCTSTDVICRSRQLPIILVGSSKDQDAVRLFNVGDTPFVYQNFPGERPRIHHITAAAFSDYNGWMAIGNDRGVVKLWNLPSSL